MTDIELIKRVIRLMPIGSKDETRWHLMGVAMSGSLGKVKLEVTDGHKLIIESYDSQWGSTLGDKTFMFRREHLPILKMWVKEWGFIDTDLIAVDIIDDNKLHLEIKGTGFDLEETDRYPDTDRIVPIHINTVSVSFNAKYLYELVTALRESKTHQVTLTFKTDKKGVVDPMGTILVKCPQREATTVLMPCRL